MNETIIANWNVKVGTSDLVYHLGDFGMGQKDQWPKFRSRLPGKIILVRGNHDKGAQYMRDVVGMDEVYDSLYIELDGVKVYMSHRPERGDLPQEVSYRLAGHVHSLWERQGSLINVGMDVSGLVPLTFEELLARDSPEVYTKCYICGETLDGFRCPNKHDYGRY